MDSRLIFLHTVFVPMGDGALYSGILLDWAGAMSVLFR